VRRVLEIRGHAAADAAVLPDAAPERHALQIALEVVVPLVVRAGEIARVAGLHAAERHAAVRAHVLDDVQRAIQRAGEDDRPLADRRALEVAGRRHLGLEPDVAPVPRVEEALELAPVDVLARVRVVRDAAGPLAFPRDRRMHAGDVVHARPPFAS
jgi:hypothetical protein